MAHTAKTKKVLELFGESAPVPALNPVVKPPEKETVPVVFVKSENGTQFVNVSFLLINEQIGSIMERFHCCTCDKCIDAATSDCFAKLPRTVIKVKRKSDEDTVNRTAAEMRSEAIRIITKAVMFVKSNPRH